MKKYLCEFIGTAVLVLFGCGAAVIAGESLGVLGISMAFGLSIVAMAYVIGNVSGCHINPAVSLAVLINGGMSVKDFCGYVVSQILGAACGSGLLIAILNFMGKSFTDPAVGLGANVSNVGIIGGLIVEAILTFVFIYTILGVTSDEKKGSVAGIVIGLTLAFVHILGINLTGTSVNPARSIAPALFVGGEALSQLWIFIVGPLVGAAIAALVFKCLNKEEKAK